MAGWWASLLDQLVKNLPAMQVTWIPPLGWEGPLEREQLSTPVFWPGELHVLYSPWGRKELDTTEQFSLSWLCPDSSNLCGSVVNCTFQGIGSKMYCSSLCWYMMDYFSSYSDSILFYLRIDRQLVCCLHLCPIATTVELVSRIS